MPRMKALEELHFLSRLLSNEFVYSTEGLEKNVERTIASLAEDDVVLVEEEMIGLSPIERQNGRNNFGSFRPSSSHSFPRILTSPKTDSPRYADFFLFLVWPFVETYWLAAVSLFALTPTNLPPSPNHPVAWYAEKNFQASAQLLAKTLFAQGDVSYLEACNQCVVPLFPLPRLSSSPSVTSSRRLRTRLFVLPG